MTLRVSQKRDRFAKRRKDLVSFVNLTCARKEIEVDVIKVDLRASRMVMDAWEEIYIAKFGWGKKKKALMARNLNVKVHA